MDKYFEEFKNKMRNQKRIHKSIVDKYFDDICFMVDTNFIYAQAILPRVVWLRPMLYEVNIDEVIVEMTTLLSQDINVNSEPFGTYDIIKHQMYIDTSEPKIDKNRKKIIKGLEGKYDKGEGSCIILKQKHFHVKSVQPFE